MMTPRIIGYQAKSAKHSTAPMRKAYPVRLSRTLRPRLVRGPRMGGDAGFALVRGTAMTAIDTPGSAGDGEPAHRLPVPLAQPLARSWFTLSSAVLSRVSMFAAGSVSTADIAASRTA